MTRGTTSILLSIVSRNVYVSSPLNRSHDFVYNKVPLQMVSVRQSLMSLNRPQQVPVSRNVLNPKFS